MSLNYIAMAQAILGHGYFAATNSNYSYKFVFDLAKYYPLFREEVRGASSLISFSEFIDPFPGRAILGIAGADRDTVALLSYSKKSSFDNARLDERAVESNYLANFLGSHLQPHTLQDLESAAEVIIQKRIKLVAEVRNEVRNSFFQAFDC